tara:strand:- start:928 stop:1566 length:639 start_codon:yes stop_codon:yes gene_type:complete
MQSKKLELELYPGVLWKGRMYLLAVRGVEYGTNGTVLSITVAPQCDICDDSEYMCTYVLCDGDGNKFLFRERDMSHASHPVFDVHGAWFWKKIAHAARFIADSTNDVTACEEPGRGVGKYAVWSQANPIKRMKEIDTSKLVVQWKPQEVVLVVPQESYDILDTKSTFLEGSVSGLECEFTADTLSACNVPDYQYIAALSQEISYDKDAEGVK